MYSRIRIPAKWVGEANSFNPSGERFGIADFKLGLGSCGKEVLRLEFLSGERTVEVIQTCSDGERKKFIYQRKHLTGRIELTML